MTVAVLTVVAGGVGAVLRHLVDTAVSTRLGSDRPWGIAVVNVSGSFVLGVVVALGTSGVLAEATLTVVGVGLAGGHTTFSTTSVDTVRLALAGHHRAAVANGVGHLVVCVAAVVVGLGAGAAAS